ncbi:uncharacterized protein [Parasteatoda tepidariorum]|uniref:uncharacterized protein n=1 Tax=Parasteatoda tepidariorum TaxID=114398 RepID=UPI0039BD061C
MDFENYTIFLQTTNDLFVGCTLGLTGNDIREDDDCRRHFTRSVFSPKTEFPIVSSCFTFNSMIGKPNTSSETAPAGAYFAFTMNLDPARHPPFINKTKAQISFHNSRQLIDPYEQGFSMEMGKKYTFRLKKIEKNLLPYPYDTNCIDYLEKWKARGGHGPTNERECIQECYTNITLTAYGLSQSKKGFNIKREYVLLTKINHTYELSLLQCDVEQKLCAIVQFLKATKERKTWKFCILINFLSFFLERFKKIIQVYDFKLSC